MPMPPRARPWPALADARSRAGAPRLPVFLRRPAADPAGTLLGSVAERDLDALRAHPDLFELDGAAPSRVTITAPPGPALNAWLDTLHRTWRDEGRIVAWRDEPYPLRDPVGGEHGTVERASSRFWGLLTLGVHANGYLADEAGRPTHLWIARRAFTKPTDPGRLDTLVGGGVPAGQSPDEAVVREGWEEAGLQPQEMAGRRAGRVLVIDADIPEGRQLEWLHVVDLALPAGWRPRAIDGEVHEHLLLPVEEALALACAGEFTTDAALATLDFALRHGVAGPDAPALAEALAPLVRP